MAHSYENIYNIYIGSGVDKELWTAFVTYYFNGRTCKLGRWLEYLGSGQTAFWPCKDVLHEELIRFITEDLPDHTEASGGGLMVNIVYPTVTN